MKTDVRKIMIPRFLYKMSIFLIKRVEKIK